MTPLRRVIVHGIWIVLLFGALVSSVFAWLSTSPPPPIGEITIGELSYDLSTEGTTLSLELPIAELMYVDLLDDVRDDQTGMLSAVSTGFFLTLSGLEGTIPWRVLLSLESEGDLMGLLPLWILEGVNVDETHVDQSDYHAIFQSFGLDETATEEDWRQAIEAHNQAVIASIAAIEIQEHDTIRVQVVFWGDYDILSSPGGFLTRVYALSVVVNVFQTEKEIVG